MFRPAGPYSGVYDVLFFVFLKESASLILLASGYILYVSICGGGLNMRCYYLLLLCYFLYCYSICVFLLTCVFLFCSPR
jgi:hypothetical protein